MELNKKQIIYFLLIIIWMAIVFAFSNQPAYISSKASGGITDRVVKIITKDDKKMPKNQRDLIETVVRKCAHFGLYLIGGLLITNFFNTTRVKEKHIIIYSILFAVIYACTDELHQLFVNGRSGEIRDIIIDTLGASTGTLLFYFFKVCQRRKQK